MVHSLSSGLVMADNQEVMDTCNNHFSHPINFSETTTNGLIAAGWEAFKCSYSWLMAVCTVR